MPKLAIPLSVPNKKKATYERNFKIATHNSGRLFLFAGDQKVEHLNTDFYGPGIAPADSSPEHLFQIASGLPGAVLAVHIGLLARYGHNYSQLPFILKVNGKSPIDNNPDDSYSAAWLPLDQIIRFQEQSKLKIVGLGYTVYLGGKREAEMLKEAAATIQAAHQAGLLAIIWMYPRNSKIKDEDNIHLIAGGAGVAACLGADFVKVKYPYKTANSDKKAAAFQEVIKAAGKTQVICVGGSKQGAEELLKHLERQLKNGSTGLAIGRNLHQRPLTEAIALGKAISAMLHQGQSYQEALKVLKSKVTPKKKGKNRILELF